MADPAGVVASLRASFGVGGPPFANIEDSTKSSAKDYQDYRDYYLHEKLAQLDSCPLAIGISLVALQVEE